MSLTPGALKRKDPQAEKNAAFNWTAYLGNATIVSQSVVVSGPDAALTADNVAVADGDQQVNYRLVGGTRGRKYTVTCRITTNESPAQTEERSITVLVQDQ